VGVERWMDEFAWCVALAGGCEVDAVLTMSEGWVRVNGGSAGVWRHGMATGDLPGAVEEIL
jgi:hypothetical protein